VTRGVLENQLRRVVRLHRLQKAHPQPASHRPGDPRLQTMCGEQFHDDGVSQAHPETALQLQTANREIDDVHGLEPAAAVDQGNDTRGVTLIAPTQRSPLGMSGE
jgi:hypothetical protein